MKRETILLIRNPNISSNSVLAAAEATGHQVVSTSSSQAIALVFVMRCVAAVLLDYFGTKEDTLELARELRAICNDVPIILLSAHPIEHLPSYVDASLNTRMPSKLLADALLKVLSVARNRHLRTSLRHAS
jgi:CheY-like chemotaxis protein